jgi:hypothetical protein
MSMGELSCIMLKPSLLEPFPFFFSTLEVAPTRSFYSSRPGSYNETRGPTGGPKVVETLYIS